MKSKLILALLISVSLTGCATHTKQILIGGLVGGMVGAGLGYTVVHHGTDRKYEVPNTIITSALVALGTMGVMAYHYNAIEEQKIEITSRLTRPVLLENSVNDKESIGASILQNEYTPEKGAVGKYSLKLDDETRWVYPSFRKRQLKPETSGNEFVSSRFTWEVVRQGFFVNREQTPSYFSDEDDVPKKNKNPQTLEK